MIYKKLFLLSSKQLRHLLCCFLVIPCFACPSDKAHQNRGSGSRTPDEAWGPYSIKITPHEATRNSVLTLILEGFAPSDAEISWLIDGDPVSSTLSYELKVSDFAEAGKGSVIQAKAEVKGRAVFSNIIHLSNAAPKISEIKLLPEVFKPGDMLHVRVSGNDSDGDPVSFLYEWSLNGLPAGTGSSIESPAKKGDKVSVKVTPFDGVIYGDPVFLEEREIRNMPPVITAHNAFNFDGKTYSYQVRASDPDGDRLAYSIESPAPGISIDGSSGLLQWIVPQEFKGKKDVTVVVNDGNGGSAKYTIGITLQ